MKSKIIYVLGDGVQYRFLRDLVELRLKYATTDELRHQFHIVQSSQERATQMENVYYSKQIPSKERLYFLSDSQTKIWIQKEKGGEEIPRPDQIHVLLESPFRKNDWIRKIEGIKQWAISPVDVVLCDTQRVGLSTDTSYWEDDFREGKRIIEQIGITVKQYTLQTTPVWLYSSVPVDLHLFKQRLQKEMKQLRERMDDKEIEIEYDLYSMDKEIAVTPAQLKHRCYQKYDASIICSTLSDMIWIKAEKQFLSISAEIWKNIWQYYRTELIGTALLWDEESEERELNRAMCQTFKEYKPAGKIIMAKNEAEYKKLIESPDVKKSDILECERKIQQFFENNDSNYSEIYAVMKKQIQNKILKMEKVLNE